MKNACILSFLIIMVIFFNAYGDDKSHETIMDGKLQTPASKDQRDNLSYDRSSIYVYLHSRDPNGYFIYPQSDLIIENKDGLKTGYNPINGIYYDQILRSSYDFEGIYDPTIDKTFIRSKIVEIDQPSAGNYKLYVIGTDMGTYGLDLYIYDPDDNPFGKSVKEQPITKNEIHTYCFFFPKTVGGAISVDVDKNGNHPSDVNKFLAYKCLSGRQTNLPSGTTTYDLTILYGDAIIASSLKAKLNDKDITNLFDPVPGSTEVVTLELSQGRNTLVLSSEANLNDRIAEDKDRLVFIVP